MFLMPNWYTASVKILPPQQSQSNAIAILGQLGALGGGATQALGLKNPSDIFVAMLKSRTISDNIIRRFDLQKVYGHDLISDSRRELRDNIDIAAAREGVITIEVDDKDPRRSAEMANAYIEELETLTLQLAISEAGQRRLFFEKQLNKAKQDLTAAEIELQKLQEKTGIVNPSGQASLSVSAAAGLRAQITAKEVQLVTLRSFAADQNPDLIRIERELQGLREQLAKTTSASGERGDVLVGISRVPGASIEFIKKYRDVKYYETLFELLAKQFEIAKIDEAKNATLIQVLDRAAPPERKSKPRRLFTTIVVAAVAGFLAIICAFLIEAKDRATRDPLRASRWAALHQYLRW
jgi:uncharacterized protein involved in exopolysaccharide biosynthesis